MTEIELAIKAHEDKWHNPNVPQGKAGKKKYLDFVWLTDDEYGKLVKTFGQEGAQKKILNCNLYLGAKGRRYKSHYCAIMMWDSNDEKQMQAKPQNKLRLLPIAGKTCSVIGCRLPAVYKDSAGQYDNYKCCNHLPKEVKEIYG